MAANKRIKMIAKNVPAKKSAPRRGRAAAKKIAAVVAAVVAPAPSVQTAKLIADFGYHHIGDDGKPDASNPVSKNMSVVRAGENLLHDVGASGMSLATMVAMLTSDYGNCGGKLRQQFRVWSGLNDDRATKLTSDHSDHRKAPLCEYVGKTAALRFKPGKSVRHNHTTLTAVEIVRLAKLKPAKS